MRTDALEKHIFDTIKEWQMKIGYREECMKLYYPQISLIELLGLGQDTSKEQLDKKLFEFCRMEETRLGKMEFSDENGRYCINVPVEGCTYIAQNVPDSVFLKNFLEVITKAGNTLEQVRECFAAYAEENNTKYVEMDKREEDLGHVFFLEKEALDEYVYCVEADEFGLTYHRFTKADFEKLCGIQKA